MPLNIPPRKAKAPKDGTGLDIPVESIKTWQRRQEACGLVMELSAIAIKLRTAQQCSDSLFTELNLRNTIAMLRQVQVDVERSIPYAVCPECNGKIPTDCGVCKGRGMVSKFYWTHIVPEETKKATGRK